MNPFCQIEFANDDVGTLRQPCCVTASPIRFERIIRIRGKNMTLTGIVEVVVILAVIIAAIRFFVKRA